MIYVLKRWNMGKWLRIGMFYGSIFVTPLYRVQKNPYLLTVTMINTLLAVNVKFVFMCIWARPSWIVLTGDTVIGSSAEPFFDLYKNYNAIRLIINRSCFTNFFDILFESLLTDIFYLPKENSQINANLRFTHYLKHGHIHHMVYRSVIKELDLAHFVTVFYWFEEEKKHCLTIKRVWCISTVSVYSVIKHVNYDKVKRKIFSWGATFADVLVLNISKPSFFLLANYYFTCCFFMFILYRFFQNSFFFFLNLSAMYEYYHGPINHG